MVTASPVFTSTARALLVVAGAFIAAGPAFAQAPRIDQVGHPFTEPLWPDGAPGAVGDEDMDRPILTVYLPAPSQAVGTGIVICPGGGYAALALDHEGHQVARWLTARGIAGFVVQYRLGPRYRHPAMLQDVLRAIRLVRRQADEFGIQADRVGVMGFSAGGHLASSAATLFELPEALPGAADDGVSSRPDFAVLGYPVIVFDAPITHRGSQRFLLGEQQPPDLVARLSTERQVTPRTPPTFLFHTNEDTAVPPENSVQFYLALRRAGVPAELHIYERGRHGVGLAPNDPILSGWTDALLGWLQTRGLLTRIAQRP